MAYNGDRFRWENRRVHTVASVFGEVVYEPGGTCGPRIQRAFELVILHSGECQATINQTVLQLKPGVVYRLLPGGREHFQFASTKESHHSWCTVRPGSMPRGLETALRRSRFSVPCSDLFRSLLEAALHLQPFPGHTPGCLVDHLALSLFAEFCHTSSRQDQDLFGDPAVHAFTHFIREHFGEEECLSAAQRAAGVSRNTLLNKFHQVMKTTPAHYLWSVRLERAVAMLNETGHSVAEIAYQCGFKNPFHFSRLVKERFGHCPKEIRRQTWAADGGG